MKDFLAGLLRTRVDPNHKLNLMREYLQARILGSLQSSAAMVPLAFQGGTALRFLYSIPRHSEDLDFALEGDAMLYDFRGYLRAIQAELQAEGYDLDIKASDRRIVHNAFIRFPGLLYEMGLSAHPGQIFSVKIEVDTRPPEGAGLETSIVRHYVTLRLQHHDKPSLLAGKLHAILQRPYPKGRDVYDLFWYLSDPSWPPPNLVLLHNALRQTGWDGPEVNAGSWRQIVAERLQAAGWERILEDLRPFLEKEEEASLLSKENVLQVLARAGS